MATNGSRFRKRPRPGLAVMLPIAGVCLVGWSVYALWSSRQVTGEVELRCSAGHSFTRRYEIGCALAQSAATHALRLDMLETAGTIECLQKLNDGQLDIALVSGGICTGQFPRIRQIASLGESPLHLLVKQSRVTVATEGLEMLRNCRVNVGELGSGEFVLANEILEFAGIRPKDAAGQGDYYQTNLSRSELLARARMIAAIAPEQRQSLVDELPDAVFMESALPSRIAQALVAAADYQLLPIPYVRAFAQDSQLQMGRDAQLVDVRYVRQTVIPAFTYRVYPPVPAEDCETLGVQLLVVARADLPPEATRRLLASIYTGEFAWTMQPRDLLKDGAEYPLLAAARTYLERRNPLLVGDFVEKLQNLLRACGAFSAGLLALYGYFRTRRGRRPEFFLEEIGAIERLAHESSAPGGGHSIPLRQDAPDHSQSLEDRLGQLKQQVIREYAHGELKGEINLMNILTLIADTRQSLSQAGVATRATPGVGMIPRRRVDHRPTAAPEPPHDLRRAG